jgi:hypothetical protein
MIRNLTEVVTFLRTPKARLIGAVLLGLIIGYTLKSSNSNYAIASSANGTFRMDTTSGKTWMISSEDGRTGWSRVGEH